MAILLVEKVHGLNIYKKQGKVSSMVNARCCQYCCLPS